MASLWLITAFSAASAQQPADRIEPDRPDFTIGTGIVESGHVQVESGVAFERGREQRQWTIGDAVVRIPLADWFEFHLGVPSYRVSHDPARAVGFDDAGIEARIRFVRSDAFELGLQVGTNVPSGSRRVAERYAQPRAVLAATFKPSKDLNVVVDVGGGRASNDRRHYAQALVAASLDLDLSEKWNVFVESYAFNREEYGGGGRRFAAAGALYFIDRSTAIDVRIGTGLHNGNGIDRLANLGFSHRF